MSTRISAEIPNDELHKATHEIEILTRATKLCGVMFTPAIQKIQEVTARITNEQSQLFPLYQRGLAYTNSLEYQAMQKYLESPEYRSIQGYLDSPEYRAMQKNLDSPAFQAAQAYISTLSFFDIQESIEFSKNSNKSEIYSDSAGHSQRSNQAEDECPDLADSISSAVSTAEPYMSQEQTKVWFTHIRSIVNLLRENKISISDIFAVLTFLATIYFGIVQQMPNEQLDRISEQIDTTIDQNNVVIQQLDNIAEDDRALCQTLNSLTYSINLLTDALEDTRNDIESIHNDVNAIRKHCESINDGADCEIESDAADSQQDEADAQN